jgi:hypothetical protein
MNDRLEEELRRALRPVDPGDSFTHAVMSKIHADSARAAHPQNSSVLSWLPVAAAASLLVAIIINHEGRQPTLAADGQLAREQLLEALRVTSQKLDIAYQVVHNQSDASDEPDA